MRSECPNCGGMGVVPVKLPKDWTTVLSFGEDKAKVEIETTCQNCPWQNKYTTEIPAKDD